LRLVVASAAASSFVAAGVLALALPTRATVLLWALLCLFSGAGTAILARTLKRSVATW
jgi:predicted membrane-bound mannosyltransferase